MSPERRQDGSRGLTCQPLQNQVRRSAQAIPPLRVASAQAVEQLETVPSQYLKKLVGTADLWEVRAQHGGDAFRLIGFFDGRRLLVLTSGFAKKTEKTPRQEIALAEKRQQDYRSRRQQHE